MAKQRTRSATSKIRKSWQKLWQAVDMMAPVMEIGKRWWVQKQREGRHTPKETVLVERSHPKHSKCSSISSSQVPLLLLSVESF